MAADRPTDRANCTPPPPPPRSTNAAGLPPPLSLLVRFHRGAAAWFVSRLFSRAFRGLALCTCMMDASSQF